MPQVSASLKVKYAMELYRNTTGRHGNENASLRAIRSSESCCLFLLNSDSRMLSSKLSKLVSCATPEMGKQVP